jgi:hypothetical protein
LWALAVGSGAATLLGVTFWLVLAGSGLVYALARGGRRGLAAGTAVLAVGAGATAVLMDLDAGTGLPGVLGTGEAQAVGVMALFVAGLKAGLLTFGGAYTAIPYVRADTVGRDWLTDAQFLDGVALAGVLPAPMVIFCTFVGYVAGGPWGLEESVREAGPGPVLAAMILLPLLFALPQALMTAELASLCVYCMQWHAAGNGRAVARGGAERICARALLAARDLALKPSPILCSHAAPATTLHSPRPCVPGLRKTAASCCGRRARGATWRAGWSASTRWRAARPVRPSRTPPCQCSACAAAPPARLGRPTRKPAT